MTAEWMVRLTLGQQGPEPFPENRLDEVWLKCGHGVCTPLHREASDTPRMIEHPVPVYLLTRSLLAEPLSLDPRPRALSGLRPVADVVSGRIIVPAVQLAYSGSVEVHRDGRVVAKVPHSVDTLIVRQHS